MFSFFFLLHHCPSPWPHHLYQHHHIPCSLSSATATSTTILSQPSAPHYSPASHLLTFLFHHHYCPLHLNTTNLPILPHTDGCDDDGGKWTNGQRMKEFIFPKSNTFGNILFFVDDHAWNGLFAIKCTIISWKNHDKMVKKGKENFKCYLAAS